MHLYPLNNSFGFVPGWTGNYGGGFQRQEGRGIAGRAPINLNKRTTYNVYAVATCAMTSEHIKRRKQMQAGLGPFVGGPERIKALPVVTSSNNSSSSQLQLQSIGMLRLTALRPVLAPTADELRKGPSSRAAADPVVLFPLRQDGQSEPELASFVALGQIQLSEEEWSKIFRCQIMVADILKALEDNETLSTVIYSSSSSSRRAPDCLYVPLIVSNGAYQGVDWAAVEGLLRLRGTQVSLTELQTHDALRSAQLAAADSAVQAVKDSQAPLPDTCIEAALRAVDFSSMWTRCGSQDLPAAAGSVGAAVPAGASEDQGSSDGSSSSRSSKRRCLVPRSVSTQLVAQAAAANKPAALSTAAVQPPGAAAGRPAVGQQKQQLLLQQYVQRLLVVSAAAFRVESLDQSLDLQQRLEDLADNSTRRFPVPSVDLLLLVTSRPSLQDAFDSTGLRFFGSAVHLYLTNAGSLQANAHKPKTSIGALTKSKDGWMANDKREGMYYKHSLTGADCWDRQGFSPARILSGSSSRVSSAGSNLDGAVNGPAGMVTSLVAAVYIAGLGLFTAGPASNQGEPLLVSAAGMTAAAAFAVTVEIVPECAVQAVAQPNLAMVLTAQNVAHLQRVAMKTPAAAQLSSQGPPGKPFAWGCVPLSPREPLEVMEEAADYSFECKMLPTQLVADPQTRGKRGELLGDAELGVMMKLTLLQRLMQQARQQQQQLLRRHKREAAGGSSSWSISSTYKVADADLVTKFRALTCNSTLSRTAVLWDLSKLLPGTTELPLTVAPGATAAEIGTAVFFKSHADVVKMLLAAVLLDSSNPAVGSRCPQAGWDRAWLTLKWLLDWCLAKP